MSDVPINLELLIKLLKMTTSSNDAEALAAIRRANVQLAKLRADWESLLRGKVTIVADPFASAGMPTPPPPARSCEAPTPPKPRARAPRAASYGNPIHARATREVNAGDIGL